VRTISELSAACAAPVVGGSAMPLRASDVVASLSGAPGAYIHVPFCERLCPFCPYNKEVYRRDRAELYFAALKKEVDLYAEAFKSAFTSLYIGGGTPTIRLDLLADVVRLLPVVGERAIEILPTHATPDRLDELVQMGINFVSLGIQSFDDAMLRYLCRPTSRTDNLRAVECSLGRFACVDVDLMFDVAFEEPDVFLRDLERCFRFGVDQVSTYPVMRFGFTPFGKAAHHPREEHQVLRQAWDLARRWGYERRSVWTFNRAEAPSYTSITRPFYLGMGAGSASYTGRLFAVNEFDVGRYAACIEANRLPVARLFKLGRLAASAYYVFWQAYAGTLDVRRIERSFGRASGTIWRVVAELLRATHYMRCEGDRYHLTERGFDQYHDLERWVTYHLIEPLWRDMTPSIRIARERRLRRVVRDGRAMPACGSFETSIVMRND
jgi:menaquinone C8-methyltransferase